MKKKKKSFDVGFIWLKKNILQFFGNRILFISEIKKETESHFQNGCLRTKLLQFRLRQIWKTRRSGRQRLSQFSLKLCKFRRKSKLLIIFRKLSMAVPSLFRMPTAKQTRKKKKIEFVFLFFLPPPSFERSNVCRWDRKCFHLKINYRFVMERFKRFIANFNGNLKYRYN